MKKSILLAILFVTVFISNSFCQRGGGGSVFGATITGCDPSWEGSTCKYTLSYTGTVSPGGVFSCTVNNGTIVNSNVNPYNGLKLFIEVTWNCNVTSGSITVNEQNTGFSFVYDVPLLSYLSYPDFCNVASPAMQNVFYGQAPQQLSVTNCSPYCSSFYSFTYQWQASDIIDPEVIPYNPVNWQNIPGAINADYTPPAMLAYGVKAYRRISNFYYAIGPGPVLLRTVYSKDAYVRFLSQLNGGIISSPNPIVTNYYGSPNIIASPAIGGLCYSANYVYTWESSSDGGATWVIIGSGEQFPSTAPGIIANTIYRRKVVCGTDTKYSNELLIAYNYISPYLENLNYVRINQVLIPDVTSWPQADNLPVGDKFQTTTYYDGLGRPYQKVDKEMSLNNGAWNDLVTHIEYDLAGRTAKNYLPYPTATDIGKFKNNALFEQSSFIRNYYAEAVNAPTYAETTFDNSPLSRVAGVKAPGTSWGGNIAYPGNRIEYDINYIGAVQGNIPVWNIDFTAGSLPYIAGYYPANSLFISKTFDDKGKRVYEYKDNGGNLILKKVQDKDDGAGFQEQGFANAGWLCTFYVYDDLGHLRYTITPKAVKYLENSATPWVMPQQVADELCFYDEYDKRGRNIIKHSPGAGKVYAIFDKRDRAVLTQNEKQRGRKQWAYILYDEFDRSVVTGLYDKDISRDNMQLFVDGLNSGTVTITIFTGANETINAHNPVAGSAGYCNGCSNMVVNTVTYYDREKSGMPLYTTNFTFAASTNPYIQPQVKTARVEGMETGSKVRVLDDKYDDNIATNDLFLRTSIFYDEKGRQLQIRNENIKNGIEDITMQYDFSGKVLSVCQKHNLAAAGMNGFTVISKNDFDKIGRLATVAKRYNSGPFKKLVSFEYDVFGRVMKKLLDPDYNGGLGIEALEYSYNIQGWITGINKGYALSNSSLSQWNHYFGQYYGYDNRDNMFTQGQLNGAVAGTIWRSQGDNMPRKYDYQYDNAGRLTAALFTQKDRAVDALWNTASMDFTVNELVYDENGNIKKMYQKGIVPGVNGGLFVDKLEYTYQSVLGGEWSNKLLKVFDNNPVLGATNNGKLGDFKDQVYNVNTDDYEYDENGNLIKDNNKKIIAGNGLATGVVYNYLDKPQLLNIYGKSKVEFIYDATGEKLGKKVTPIGNAAVTIWFMGEFIYEEAGGQVALRTITHEEGRIKVYDPSIINSRVTIGGFFNLPGGKRGVFEFFVKDNLTNTRMVLSEETHVEYHDCRMETANLTYEQSMFGNTTGNEVSASRFAVSSIPGQSAGGGWQSNSSWTANPSTAMVSRLIGTGQKIGPNIIMKVMAGDELTLAVKYYYQINVNEGAGSSLTGTLIGSLINALSGGNTPAGAVKDNAGAINSNLMNTGHIQTFLNNNNSSSGIMPPKAYVNYLFFDENFNFVKFDNITGLGSSAKRVIAPGDGQTPLTALLTVPKNGYVYVYLSNESNEAVYFDDFEVQHSRGRMVEDNAYYPYGLKIKGVCAKAFDKPLNKYNYQSDFSEEEEETGWNEFDLRMYDAQIGRWIQNDPYEQYASGYVGMGNDPINRVDEDGGFDGWVGALAGAIVGGSASYAIAKNNGAHDWGLAAYTLGGSALGAGIGYAADMSWFNEARTTSSFGANFRAFYAGLVGYDGMDVYSHRVIGAGKVRVTDGSAISPNVWDWLGDLKSFIINFKFPSLNLGGRGGNYFIIQNSKGYYKTFKIKEINGVFISSHRVINDRPERLKNRKNREKRKQERREKKRERRETRRERREQKHNQ